MTTVPATEQFLRSRIETLTEKVREEESLSRALQGGEVDAVVVLEQGEPKLFRIHSDEPLYRSMVEEMSHGMATVLVDGTVVYANRHLLMMAGHSAAAFLGENLVAFIDEEDRPLFAAMLRRAVETPQELEVTFRSPSGDGPVLISARRLAIDGSEAIGLAIVDLREQRARRAAEEASKAKDDLLAAVSHELRTPLTTMMGWAQMLELELGDGSRSTAAVRQLKAAILAQARIVDDLLDLSRSERGALPIFFAEVDLRECVQTAASYVALQAESKSVALELEVPDEPLPVRGDGDRLRQVFVNLLTNALKFTAANGSVRMQVDRRDGQVQVSVADTGIGISRDFLPFVFEPFRRADSAQRYQGLGVGLAIAKRLTEAHGGSISADSEGVGCGATFVVRLPVSATTT
jgi:PAS domain S-box-containing protein